VGLIFKYKSKFGIRGIVPVPILNVTFTYPKTGKSIDVDCLLDSGADDTVINADLAGQLGIDLTTGPRYLYQGISRDPTPAYDHGLLMQVEDDNNKFEINAAFMPGLQTACLLGRNGFFENYRVVLDQNEGQFELEPVVARAL
jgi:hypothetical protein